MSPNKRFFFPGFSIKLLRHVKLLIMADLHMAFYFLGSFFYIFTQQKTQNSASLTQEASSAWPFKNLFLLINIQIANAGYFILVCLMRKNITAFLFLCKIWSFEVKIDFSLILHFPNSSKTRIILKDVGLPPISYQIQQNGQVFLDDKVLF